MDRRGFLKALGAGAAAVSFGLPSEAAKVSPSITSDGWGSGETLHVGDIFTITGENSKNPITGRDTGYPQMFVITDVASDTVNISPMYRGRNMISQRRVEPVVMHG